MANARKFAISVGSPDDEWNEWPPHCLTIWAGAEDRIIGLPMRAESEDGVLTYGIAEDGNTVLVSWAPGSDRPISHTEDSI